jgi:hypothetical protein
LTFVANDNDNNDKSKISKLIWRRWRKGDVMRQKRGGVISIQLMSRVWWEEWQQHEHPVQRSVGKSVKYNHLCNNHDVFWANNGVMVLRPLLGMGTDMH